MRAPLAGLEPATPGPGNRCTIRCATRALGRSEGVEPVDCGVTDHRVAVTLRPPWRSAALYAAQQRVHVGSLGGGGGNRTPSRVSRGGSLATSCNTVLPRLPTASLVGKGMNPNPIAPQPAVSVSPNTPAQAAAAVAVERLTRKSLAGAAVGTWPSQRVQRLRRQRSASRLIARC